MKIHIYIEDEEGLPLLETDAPTIDFAIAKMEQWERHYKANHPDDEPEEAD